MFDPDLSDANGLLMAKSGGGKTLAAQQMLLMAARANPLISILERGDSYQPLVELMGGEMIEMSLDSDQTINPWDLPKGEIKPSNDQISFLKNLTRHMLGENTPPDLDIDLLDSVLMEAIASTYKRCSAKSSNPIPLFGDLAAELAHWQDRDRNQKINAMAQMASTKLRAWVDEGPYAQLFDRPTTVELTNPWLYFNVEKLKDDPRLERAMSLLIAHTATYRSSGANGQPSIVLLDECWALLESPILASVVVQLFRTARKRNASVLGIQPDPGGLRRHPRQAQRAWRRHCQERDDQDHRQAARRHDRAPYPCSPERDSSQSGQDFRPPQEGSQRRVPDRHR